MELKQFTMKSQCQNFMESLNLVVLGFLLMIPQFIECIEPPIILNNETIVVSGETLRLTCRGDGPIHWKGPNEFDNRVKFTYSEDDNETRRFETTLQINNTEYGDVGLYTCSYNSSDSSGTNIYIYVNDSQHALLGRNSPFNFLNAMPGDSLTIPCRPTSPYVEISISKDIQTDIDLRNDNYDPEHGLLIDPVVATSAGTYYCRGKVGNVEDLTTWHLAVAAPPQAIPLRKPRINATDDGYATVGTDFVLDCIAEEDKNIFYSLNWTEPANLINSRRAEIQLIALPNDNPRKKRYKSQLRVFSARKEDAGEYVCRVQSPSSSAFATKEIKVYDITEKFLNVTTISREISQKKRMDAQWVININSFPKDVDYYWKDRYGKEIRNDRYKIEKRGSEIILKVLDTTLDDSGFYKFIVELRGHQSYSQTLDLKLTITDAPDVTLEPRDPEMYYEYGLNYTIKCIVRGYPIPRITWGYMEADSKDDSRRYCRIHGNNQIKTANTVEKGQTVVSTINFSPMKHGILTCRAENTEGVNCKHKAVKIIDFPGSKEYGIIAPQEFIDQDAVQLVCALSKVSGKSGVQWKKKLNGTNELIPVQNTPGIEMRYGESPWSWQRILVFPKINKTHTGEYVCLVGGDDKLSQESQLVQVKDMISPKIKHTNLNQTEINLKEGEQLRLECQAMGAPTPLIQWTKDGILPKDWTSKINYTLEENGNVLILPFIRSIASGRYACMARNRNGTDSAYMDIEVEGAAIPMALILLIVVFVVVILILIFCLARKHYENYKKQLYLKEKILNGDPSNINPELGTEDQANLLPYDKKWEFPRDRLKLGMQLGSGAFGRVIKGEAIGIDPDESCSIVAVKMVKASADESHIMALMSELKIMVHLGRHVNVVNLLGACTENLIKKKELLVIVEYCKYGSLLNYMHRHRRTFINQLDPVRGMIDSTIFRQAYSRSSQQSEAPRLNYASLTFTDTGNTRTASNGYRTLEELTVDPQAVAIETSFSSPRPEQLNTLDVRHGSSADYYGQGSHAESMCTDMSFVSNAPTMFGTDGRRISSETTTWNELQYRGDYQQCDVKPIKSTDLLVWAFQVSRGMEYLASRKVLHGDLAARNILLAENNVVKICDFGLAKEMYKDYNYKKKSEGVLLPVKWMAIESIYYGIFSTQSDAWSFGVVLWELFTLGKTPYPGMEADDRFYKMLNEGYRMEKPPLAPSSIYDIMLECWSHETTERPSFTNLVDRIGDLMDEGHRQQYLDLNVPYDRMNQEWLSEQQEDYLTKMGGTEFRPTPERQYENIPQDMDSGYLIPTVPTTSHPNQIPATEYQNIANHGEPHGHILAHNAGYVFMSNAPPVEDSGDMNIGNCNGNSEIPGISNINYVQSHLFGPGKFGDLDKVVEEMEKQQDAEQEIRESTNKQGNHENHATSNGNGHRNLRRQKNDSGVGSIDSSHFEQRSPVDLMRRGSEESEFEKQEIPKFDSQHNVAYVSHAPFQLKEISNEDLSNTQTDHQQELPVIISNGGKYAVY